MMFDCLHFLNTTDSSISTSSIMPKGITMGVVSPTLARLRPAPAMLLAPRGPPSLCGVFRHCSDPGILFRIQYRTIVLLRKKKKGGRRQPDASPMAPTRSAVAALVLCVYTGTTGMLCAPPPLRARARATLRHAPACSTAWLPRLSVLSQTQAALRSRRPSSCTPCRPGSCRPGRILAHAPGESKCGALICARKPRGASAVLHMPEQTSTTK
jgi:hypothetical protein